MDGAGGGGDGGASGGGLKRPPALLAPMVWGVEQLVGRATGRPATVRWDTGAMSALRGRIERLSVGVSQVRIGGLLLDHVVVTILDARLRPGRAPRLVSGPVEARATVAQEAIDAWVGASGLPLQLHLGDDGVRATAGIGSLRVVDVLTALTVHEGWLRLRPVEAIGRPLPDILGAAFTGNLPLPALPEETELLDVEHREGSMVARVSLTEFDEALDAGVAGRLRGRLEAVEDTGPTDTR